DWSSDVCSSDLAHESTSLALIDNPKYSLYQCSSVARFAFGNASQIVLSAKISTSRWSSCSSSRTPCSANHVLSINTVSIALQTEGRGNFAFKTISVAIVCSRSEEHTSALQSRFDLVCRLLLERKNTTSNSHA